MHPEAFSDIPLLCYKNLKTKAHNAPRRPRQARAPWSASPAVCCMRKLGGFI